jgi:hypothetical protein
MKYRKYTAIVGASLVVLMGVALSGCASSGGRSIDSVSEEETQEQRRIDRLDGREPQSLQGNFTWLNEVEDDFGRIAAETSNRAVASQNKQEVLLKGGGWTFSFLPKANHFYISLQGVNYRMVQTKIDEGERFAFAAEGQSENPLTFSVARSSEVRGVASQSSGGCETELSYWNKSKKSYVNDKKPVVGAPCERMLTLLKDYVP